MWCYIVIVLWFITCLKQRSINKASKKEKKSRGWSKEETFSFFFNRLWFPGWIEVAYGGPDSSWHLSIHFFILKHHVSSSNPQSQINQMHIHKEEGMHLNWREPFFVLYMDN